MQSRLMTEEEIRLRKKSSWYRVHFSGNSPSQLIPRLGPVKNFPTNLSSLTYITTLVIKHNNLRRLPQELGNLTNLNNLDASFNKLEIIPGTIGDLEELRTLILNDNRLSDLPNEIGRLHNLRHLNLQSNPLNGKLMQIYSDGSELSVRRMIRMFMDNLYSYHIKSNPPPRMWRKIEDGSPGGYPLSVMTYNVLSPHYATQYQYPYCPSWALDWDFRRRRILEEIFLYNANIICLQEVDTNQFEEVFKPELSKQNYNGIFLPKSRSKNMDPYDAKRVDGCAIFWQRNKFDKICEFHHEFMLSAADVNDNPSPVLHNRVIIRDNVALGAVFQTREKNPKQFCVTNGHIYWHPEHSDVKVIQTLMWTAELYKYLNLFFDHNLGSHEKRADNILNHEIVTSFEKKISGKAPHQGQVNKASMMPVIMCGDFNSLPESGVIDFLRKGQINKTDQEFLDLGLKYQFDKWNLLEETNVLSGDTLLHNFQFDRAYKKNQGMTVSNFTYEFKGLIDHIFYSKNHLRLLGSLDALPEEWFLDKKIKGCPHVHFPSDHFPLFVELELTDPDLTQAPLHPSQNNPSYANQYLPQQQQGLFTNNGNMVAQNQSSLFLSTPVDTSASPKDLVNRA